MHIPGDHISPREVRAQHPDAPKDKAPRAVVWLVVAISVAVIGTSLLLSWLAS